MSKKEYLRKLRRHLKRLPDHLIADILRDYEEHFKDGKQQGLSERQISKDLGDPSEVAREYLNMYPNSKKSFKTWDIIWVVVVAIIAIWLLLNLTPFIFKLTGNILMTLISLMLFLILLVLIVLIVAIVVGVVKGKEVFNFFIGDRQFSFKTDDSAQEANHRIFETRTITEPISKIIIESYLSSILVQQEDRNDIYVELVGYTTLAKNELQVEIHDHQLRIVDDVPSQTIITNHVQMDLKLVVRVPKQNFDLEVKARMGALKINGDFNHSVVSAKMGSLQVSGTHQEAMMSCEMGSMKIYNNLGVGTFMSNMGSIRWFDSERNVHRFVVEKSLGSFKNNSSKHFSQANNIFEASGKDPAIFLKSKIGSIRIES